MSTIVVPRRKYGAIESVPINEMRAGLTLGIYAPGGIGKTTLAGTVCDSDLGWPVAYLNARGNPHVISSLGDKVQVFNIAHAKDQEIIRQGMIQDRECPFKTAIIDLTNEIWSLDLRDRYGASTDIKWEMHSASTGFMLNMIRNWVDLATMPHLNLNIIFVFGETTEKRTIRGEEGVERSELMFNKALQSQVPSMVNWLGRLYIVDDKGTRCLDFRPLEKIQQSKHQVDPNDEFASQVPMEIYTPSLASILDTVKGRKPWPTDKHARPKTVATRTT